MMQYLCQAWGQRGPKKDRAMLLATGTEEIAHVEFLDEHSYVFYDPRIGDDVPPLTGRYTHGKSLDGKGEFSVRAAKPFGDEPTLAMPQPNAFAQKEQMTAPTGVLGAIKHAPTGEAWSTAPPPAPPRPALGSGSAGCCSSWSVGRWRAAAPS